MHEGYVCGAVGEALGSVLCNGCGEIVDVCEHYEWSDVRCELDERGE